MIRVRARYEPPQERRRNSPALRAFLWQADLGRCHICGEPVAKGDEWDISHEVSLALGGDDRASNKRPAHRSCHQQKTRDEAPAIAKVRRLAKAHERHLRVVGINDQEPEQERKRHVIPGSKDSRFKRRIDGRTERR